ncbi:MAG: hypothetical protein ACRDMX_01595 [Solirubrobacteraceae bacterium]
MLAARATALIGVVMLRLRSSAVAGIVVEAVQNDLRVLEMVYSASNHSA